MFATIAQTTPDAALQVFDSWWAYVAVGLPFLQATVIRPDSARWAKILISLGFAAALAIASLATADWTGATIELVILRLGTSWTISQVIFKVASDRLGVAGTDLNDLVLPHFGIKVGSAKEIIEVRAKSVIDAARQQLD